MDSKVFEECKKKIIKMKKKCCYIVFKLHLKTVKMISMQLEKPMYCDRLTMIMIMLKNIFTITMTLNCLWC